MRIKNIAALCKKSKFVTLGNKGVYSGDDENKIQYIGNGKAMYVVADLPLLSEENILTLFDAPKENDKRWGFEHTYHCEGVIYDDVFSGEVPVHSLPLSLVYGDETLTPIVTQDKIVFIDEKYFTPLVDTVGLIELYERRTLSNESYIVAKTGFLLQATFVPRIIADITFVECVEKIAKGCRYIVDTTNKTTAERPFQTRLDIDEQK